MSHIYMIRHGRPSSTWGQSADQDPGLDELGLIQARAARDSLLAMPDPPRKVVSSPLQRCRETAAPYAQAIGADVEIDAAFGEIPTPANLSQEARGPWLKTAFAGRWSEIQGDLDYDQWRRGVADSLAKRPGAAVFSHYVAINAVVSLVTDDERVLCVRPDHASITVFAVEDGTLRLLEYGREAETQVL